MRLVFVASYDNVLFHVFFQMIHAGLIGDMEDAALVRIVHRLHLLDKSGQESTQEADVLIACRVGLPAEDLLLNAVNLERDVRADFAVACALTIRIYISCDSRNSVCYSVGWW